MVSTKRAAGRSQQLCDSSKDRASKAIRSTKLAWAIPEAIGPSKAVKNTQKLVLPAVRKGGSTSALGSPASAPATPAGKDGMRSSSSSGSPVQSSPEHARWWDFTLDIHNQTHPMWWSRCMNRLSIKAWPASVSTIAITQSTACQCCNLHAPSLLPTTTKATVIQDWAMLTKHVHVLAHPAGVPTLRRSRLQALKQQRSSHVRAVLEAGRPSPSPSDESSAVSPAPSTPSSVATPTPSPGKRLGSSTGPGRAQAAPRQRASQDLSELPALSSAATRLQAERLAAAAEAAPREDGQLLITCEGCSRSFVPEAYERHAKICAKVLCNRAQLSSRMLLSCLAQMAAA